MKVFKAISSAVLICFTLVSSTSFMVGMHICSGEIQSIALFTEAEGCEKEKNLPPCHRHETPACCQNEAVIHEGTDVQYSSNQVPIPVPTSIDIEQPLLLIAEVIPLLATGPNHYYDYDPPLRACDLTVEHRVFLI